MPFHDFEDNVFVDAEVAGGDQIRFHPLAKARPQLSLPQRLHQRERRAGVLINTTSTGIRAPVGTRIVSPMARLVPGLMLSKIAHAFQVGFLLFLLFLIIDLIVAAILMSMGMMLVPPAIVSLPFKLAFFVV